MESGIYAIKNICNKKIYIGQSKRVKQRIARHKSELKHNKHHNIYLQREYNKYGVDNFEFYVIELCDCEKLNEKENYYIKKYESNNFIYGFNMTSGGENTEWNEEAIKKRSGIGNPMYGKKLTEKHIEAIKLSNMGISNKLNERDVASIKKSLLENISIFEISKKFDVESTTIHKIYRVKNWAWVEEELNDKLIEHQNKKSNFVTERNNKILQDLKNGINKKQAIEKYGVSRYVIESIIKKAKAIPR